MVAGVRLQTNCGRRTLAASGSRVRAPCVRENMSRGIAVCTALYW